MVLQQKYLVESYDPLLNVWITKQPLTEITFGQASTYLENKIYVLGGHNLSKVEVYDPLDQWSVGPAFQLILIWQCRFTGMRNLFDWRSECNQTIY